MAADAGGFGWPAGRRAAASLTFDVDAESAVLGADPSYARRMSVMSAQSYGPLVGVPRLLRLLARHHVRATFFVPGYTAERYPDVVRTIRDAGHEIAHHGYLHEPLTGVDEATEADYLDRGLDALQRVAGVRPVGYRAPMWELNWHSPRLLAERGFDYDSSLMDADTPYLLAVDGPTGVRTLVEFPIHWSLDDWEQYAYIPGFSDALPIESPAKVLEMWRAELRAFLAEGAHFVLTNHPFVSGRPSRAAALDVLVEELVGEPALWVAPLCEVAEHVRAVDAPVRRPTAPVVS